MQPVQDILNRIRWDEAFGAADFEIGYYDRVEGRIIQVPFALLNFPADNRLAFELLDSTGEVRRIPYHRVREIHRNGRCIWKRPSR
jgi:uncharacterized protein (UPF0248 family)